MSVIDICYLYPSTDAYMSKYVQFLLVIAYGFLTITALFLVKQLFRIGPHHVGDWLVVAVMIAWLALCFSTVYWLTDIMLFFKQVRKPILEEEQRLILCLFEVQKRANDKKRYRLRIGERMGFNAYAIGYHTIVISKDCLDILTDKELCALLAHEMGHLKSKDCMAIMGFYLASWLPGMVNQLFRSGIRISLVLSLIFPIIGILILFFIFTKLSIFIIAGTILGFLLLMWLLNPVFSFLWLMNSRFTEYRQDAFAHQLGYGLELKQVLLKIIEISPGASVDRYSILTRSTHPILHNRIRRLEKLAGLRR
jgi:Zn-dependent protease with chaperone function